MKSFLLVFALASCWGVLYQIIFIWMPTYLTDVQHLSSSHALKINSSFLALFICLILGAGYCADHASRKYLLILSCSAMFLAAYPLFLLLSSGSLTNIYLAMTAFSLIFCLFVPKSFVCMVEAFDTEIRYTGLSLAFNVGLALFGGTCPLIATWLIEVTGNARFPAFYMMIFALLGLIASSSIKDKRGLAI